MRWTRREVFKKEKEKGEGWQPCNHYLCAVY